MTRPAALDGHRRWGAAEDRELHRGLAHGSAGYAKLVRLLGLPVEQWSEGSIVVDARGEEYLDCAGYGVFLLGHRHPEVVAAVAEALASHPMSTKVMVNPHQARAAADLAAVAPSGCTKVTFTNSGAEAIEVALKLVRSAGHGHVIAANGGFHGKTLGALSVTGRARYRDPFLPLLDDVEFVPYGDVGAIDGRLGAATAPATVLIEPVLGEGGVVVAPSGYLRDVRDSCDRHGALLVLDEVQTGLGRLGAWWGADLDDVRPDVLASGKVLGGGVMPVGAVVATERAYRAFDRDPFLHSSTFAGNPMAMAAVSSTLRVIERDGLVERAAVLGELLLDGLREAVRPAGRTVRDVRGVGLLLAIEFAEGHLAVEFVQAAMDAHLLVNHSLNADKVVRLTPSALMDGPAMQQLLGAVEQASSRLRIQNGAHH